MLVCLTAHAIEVIVEIKCAPRGIRLRHETSGVSFVAFLDCGSGHGGPGVVRVEVMGLCFVPILLACFRTTTTVTYVVLVYPSCCSHTRFDHEFAINVFTILALSFSMREDSCGRSAVSVLLLLAVAAVKNTPVNLT